MNLLEEMQAYVGLGERQQTLLRDFWTVLEPHADRVIDHFYERLMAFQGTRQVLQSDAQVDRLRGSLRRWLESTVCDERDEAYIIARQRIGQAHVDVGLAPQYMHGAMSVIIADTHEVIVKAYSPEEAEVICDIVVRAFMVDLALMTSNYVQGRDRQQLSVLQGVLVKHLKSVVLLVDAEGRVAACTPPSVVLLGRDPMGLPWLEALPPALVEAAQLAAMVDAARRAEGAITLPRVDADRRSFRVHVEPLVHTHASLLVQVEELTDALALETRVRRSESLAQLGTLSAAVAHELRNPLAGIRGAIQVIESMLPEEAPQRPIMKKVEQEVDRLNTLVTDLLTYARPRAPRADRLALRPVVERAMALAVGHVTPRVEGTGNAVGDADQVAQIVQNLVQNAEQAGANDVLVTLADGRVQVCDDGPGIEGAAGDIFEAFVTTKTKGTGLGLAISRSSAEAMGGRLALAEEGPLPGACFILELPTQAC